MNTIPLRAYHREIEQMIAANRSENALEHCQRILDRYPLCLDTFRLMGKAYLELRQYDKAEEVFQKVLAFVPDDFVGNLGMSLLREKQTNLDGTIWHMERAYEAQPSNTAIQNELRRLYKQRDGVDTPRIRLTRGALIPMYLRGNMTQQAISEIESILKDDPARMDIKVHKANALVQAGKLEEAFQVCHDILKELPYCFEANRILFENQSSSIKIEELQEIQQRLRELNPYYEFTSPERPDPEKVPENEVLFETAEELGPKTATRDVDQNRSFSALDVFDQSSSAAAAWEIGDEAKAYEAKMETAVPAEEIPSWMNDFQKPVFPGTDEGWNTGSTVGETTITPDNGFEPGKHMTIEDSFPLNEQPEESSTSPLTPPEEIPAEANPFLAVPGDSIPAAEPGDIPEWLKALASEPPATSSDAVTSPLRVPGETGVLQTGEENLDFLRTGPGEITQPSVPEPPVNKVTEAHVDSLAGVLPPSPFLTSSESTQPVPLEEGKESPPPGRELPDWLRSAVEPAEEHAPEARLRQEMPPVIPPIEPPVSHSVALENQFQEPEPENIITGPVEESEMPTPEIEQYLEQLRKDISPGDQPDWLKKENLGSDLQALFEDTGEPSKTMDLSESEASEAVEPNWMAQLKSEEVAPSPSPSTPAPTPPVSAAPPASVPNVPDWLFTPEEVEGETAPIQSETPVTHQPPPDWLAAARPDIFTHDYDLTATPEETASKEGAISEVTFHAEAMDLSEKPGEQPAAESGFPAVTPERAPSGALPEMGFLKSEPIDFMAAAREPLEDNLQPTEAADLSREGLDFSKAVPADSLPADLAALLREETVSELTTNPLEEEPTPEFSLDANLPEFGQKEPETAIPSAAVNIEGLFSEEPVSSAENIQPESISAAPPSVGSIPESLFTAPPETVNPEEIVAPEEVPAKTEPPTVPVEPSMFAAETPAFVEPPTQVTESEQYPERAQVFEPLLDITPGKPVEEVVSPLEAENISEIPVSAFEAVSIEAAPVEEVPVETAPVEAASIEAAPVETIPVEAAPVVEQSVITRPAPAAKPVIAEEKPVRPAAKPIKPAVKPKPVQRIEKPAPTPPALQRKGSGAADLARARDAVTKGDLQTALRRYMKLVNANKALDFVSTDLKDLVRKNPKNFLAWQTYGDTRLRLNHIQEALDAYAKAADLLK